MSTAAFISVFYKSNRLSIVSWTDSGKHWLYQASFQITLVLYLIRDLHYPLVLSSLKEWAIYENNHAKLFCLQITGFKKKERQTQCALCRMCDTRHQLGQPSDHMKDMKSWTSPECVILMGTMKSLRTKGLRRNWV